jgi:hypothetical protein
MSTFSHESTSLVTGILLKCIQRFEESTVYTDTVNHLKETDVTYYQHWKQTAWLSFKMAGGSVYLFIHSFLPFLFANKGHESIDEVHHALTKGKKKE